MHPNYKKAHEWTAIAIAAAIEVHKDKGPGLLESIYEKCLMRELELRKIPAVNQMDVPVEYKGMTFDASLTLDVIIDDCLIIELKAIQEVLPVHKAQLMTYMKLMNAPIGLLINFNEVLLKDGLHRMILPGANKE